MIFFSKDTSSYFRVTAELKNKKTDILKTSLFDINKINDSGEYTGQTSHIKNKKNTKKIIKKCIKSTLKIQNIIKKISTRNPPPPFTTYTLQQEANRSLRFTTKRTMSVAQKLYEEGLITYMRTDSVNLSEEALKDIKKYIVKEIGKEYYRLFKYKAKTKNVQEAHEAVRPTHISDKQIKKIGKIGEDEQKLYDLIWKRTVASQMMPAKYEVMTLQISISKLENKYFSASYETQIFPGYLCIYSNNDKNNKENIEHFKKNMKLKPIKIIGKQEYIKPPVRYNEATLVQKLKPDNLNIGRPSTTASIIGTIQSRGYVTKKTVDGIQKDCVILTWEKKNDEINENIKQITLGKDINKLVPTDLGIKVTDYLVNTFPEIMEYKFTSKMEQNLDDISNGKKIWYKVLNKFYKKFHPLIDIALSKVTKNTYTKHIIGIYEKKEILLKNGKYGYYISYDSNNISIKNNKIKLKDAIKLIKEKKKKHLSTLESKDKQYLILNGEYGPYIKIIDKKAQSKTINVSIPSNIDIDKITIDIIKELVKKKFS